MGNWQLEVFKIAMYISFPVGVFYIFNQPQYFEEWVVKTRRELFPKTSEEQRKEFKEQLSQKRREHMEKQIKLKLEKLEVKTE